jgi:mediator of RNA polymerase II transcription subunit 14
MALNGSIHAPPDSYSSPIPDVLDPEPNGYDEPPFELLHVELPVVDDGQVQLSDLVSRVVQACYAELTEMAETSVIPSTPLRRCPHVVDFVTQLSVFLACRIALGSANWRTL